MLTPYIQCNYKWDGKVVKVTDGVQKAPLMNRLGNDCSTEG